MALTMVLGAAAVTHAETAAAEIAPLVGETPGYFEILTAAAFRWFADIAVDVMVIEVGLLGRWDATNIVDSQVAVITNIGMDHNEFAGPSTPQAPMPNGAPSSPPASGEGPGSFFVCVLVVVLIAAVALRKRIF